MLLAMSTDRPTVQERYRAALGDGEQRDVVGAFGLADRRLTTGYVPTGPGEGYHIPPAPLAVALERLFAGDNHAAHPLVAIMSQMVYQHSWKVRIKIGRNVAHDIACCVLAWYRGGVCRPCGGHGYQLVPGAARPTLSERQCGECSGSGKMPLEAIVSDRGRKPELAKLARWLAAEVERESSRAGPEAMKALNAGMGL